jgi:hypothetical protein
VAIDDPQSTLEDQLAAEERAASPLARFVPRIAEVLEALPLEVTPLGPVKSIVQIASRFIKKEEEERKTILMDTLLAELRWLKDQHETTKEQVRVVQDQQRAAGEEVRFWQEQFPGLVLDALQKAEQTRSRERLKRMACVLAHAAKDGPAKAADLTEELTRVAMSLDDVDVRVLGELVWGQRGSFNSFLGSVPGEPVNDYWRTAEPINNMRSTNPFQPQPDPAWRGEGRLSGVAKKLDISEGDLQATCAKLQSFGLLAQVERNPAKTAQGTQPYAVLARGIAFVDAIKSLSGA